jgi:hypothetical protein
MSLPNDAAGRKERPIFSGFIKYFPKAMAEVAHLSKVGNDQHNPGQPLHWDRSKSGDELDALSRHLSQAGTRDTDGEWHDTKVAWRAMANLEKLLEREEGASAPVGYARLERAPTAAGSGLATAELSEGQIVPEEGFAPVGGLAEGESGYPEMADVADAEDWVQPMFQPLTFSRPPRTDDLGPDYEDDGYAVADADNAPLRETATIPDEDHNPATVPGTPSVITMWVRRTSEDAATWRDGWPVL